jgi:hypothetical protein
MSFITLLFFFPFLQPDSTFVNPIDSSGISYRQKMEELIPTISVYFPEDEKFVENGSYATAMKKNEVRKITDYNAVWKFDRNGNLLQYEELNRYHRMKYGKYSYKINYMYDNENYPAEMKSYRLSIFISKGTYVSKTNEKATYVYSADHLACKESGEILNYSNVASRMIGFRPSAGYHGDYTFDTLGHTLSYNGTFHQHKALLEFSYAGNDLTKRKVLFTDCNAGFIDSISYSFSGTSKIAKHYFSMDIPGHQRNYVLLETITTNAANKIIEIISAPRTEFPIDYHESFYRIRYSAVYTNDSLREEAEFDSLGRCCYKHSYTYGTTRKNHFTRCVVFVSSDTIGGIDTLRIVTKSYNQQGLFIKSTTEDFVRYFDNDHYHPIFYDKPREYSYSVKYK